MRTHGVIDQVVLHDQVALHSDGDNDDTPAVDTDTLVLGAGRRSVP